MAILLKTGSLWRVYGYACTACIIYSASRRQIELLRHTAHMRKLYCLIICLTEGCLQILTLSQSGNRCSPGPVRPDGANGSSDERCCQEALPDPEWRCRVLGWARCRPELLPGSSRLRLVTPSWRAASPCAACTAFLAARCNRNVMSLLDHHHCIFQVYYGCKIVSANAARNIHKACTCADV